MERVLQWAIKQHPEKPAEPSSSSTQAMKTTMRSQSFLDVKSNGQ